MSWTNHQGEGCVRGFDWDPGTGDKRKTMRFEAGSVDPADKKQAQVDRRRYRRTAGVTDRRLVGRKVVKGQTSSGSPLNRKLARYLFNLSVDDWDRQSHTVGTGDAALMIKGPDYEKLHSLWENFVEKQVVTSETELVNLLEKKEGSTKKAMDAFSYKVRAGMLGEPTAEQKQLGSLDWGPPPR